MSALWTAMRFIYCSLLRGVFGCVCVCVFCQLTPVNLCVQVFVLACVACESVCAHLSGTCLCRRRTLLPIATVCWLSRDLWISRYFCGSSVVLIALLWILIGCQKACNTCLSNCNWTAECTRNSYAVLSWKGKSCPPYVLSQQALLCKCNKIICSLCVLLEPLCFLLGWGG